MKVCTDISTRPLTAGNDLMDSKHKFEINPLQYEAFQRTNGCFIVATDALFYC